ALEWDPGSNSFEGNKALLATPRGLFSGGDTNIQGGVTTGRGAFFDFNSVPAAAQPDTTSTAPLPGRIIHAGQAFTATGTATTAATTRIKKVQVNVQDVDSKQYMQANGTFAKAQYNFLATVAAPNTASSAWSLPLTITGTRSIKLIAKTFAAN